MKQRTIIATSLMLLGTGFSFNAAANTNTDETDTELSAIVVTAEQQSKQALGYSKISRDDLEKHPVANDLSQIIRTMPGVNLTNGGNSGQRGNNRQIDLRGMGPDNTLILIDGRPVLSREATRLSWRGERDTRGDSNWVPAEMVESVEVIRGPAAARYGDGAAGGVVNIVTKKRFDAFHGSVTAFTEQPENSLEGASQRYNFNLMGPISDNLSFRIYGNFNKSDADDPELNAEHSKMDTADMVAAGREGVRNKDINALLAWNVNDNNHIDMEASWSRQENIFAGDQQNSKGSLNNEAFTSLLGGNTNIMTRQTFAVTHKGDYDKVSTKSYIQYDKTDNDRLDEGLFGGWEGSFDQYQNRELNRSTATLKNINVHTEASFPIEGKKIQQNITVGADYKYQKLHDVNSTRFKVEDLGGRAPSDYPESFNQATNPNSDKTVWGLFVENNIALNENTTILPGLRLNHDNVSGLNVSPSLNLWQKLNDQATLKFGVARAYKSPSLYQVNPNYIMYSTGYGCWNSTRCFLIGNKDLKAETSINYEVGLDFNTENTRSNITYFYNDYKNKIDAGINLVEGLSNTSTSNTGRVFQWENIDAKIQGVEGSFTWDINPSLKWRNNVTFMIESENKETGDYLTIIPKYTINTGLDWQINEKAMVGATGTFYGKQKPRKYAFNGDDTTGHQTNERDSYAVFGLVGKYDFSKNFSIQGGVRNLFDKQLYREGNFDQAGANTYNEPGRAYYMGVTAKF
ncbi:MULTISPECIES: FepA family TonB-dependent siderophore receptor [Vitreoscilla]|uniref:FepA family TonB-dependent siderophore receptor n=1 Tax=Vitreoscilla stercoraria TaxID=61 RepID=A0ABY4E7M9_VITST|nr:MULTISPECIES: FepA family TonB-dependent siderophore receptor [Vitreoscilla]AUZ04956.1 TonB-dependent siderophore receptor [Vitreoscilla sp. C1]UOO91400.1 FepA family TonB-dependent siderophore receptor [Vitreoscilla stercoraria]